MFSFLIASLLPLRAERPAVQHRGALPLEYEGAHGGAHGGPHAGPHPSAIARGVGNVAVASIDRAVVVNVERHSDASACLDPADLAVAAAPQTVAPGGGEKANPNALELPTEIWGEVMQFSSRHDILNLRATGSELKSLADEAITEITLARPGTISAFANSHAFPCVETLRLRYADNQSLHNLAARLTAQPHRRFALELLESFECLKPTALLALNRLPVSSLTITRALYEDTEALRVLQQCPFSVDLDGYFSRGALASVARIPKLRTLVVHARDVSDECARWFSGHPALQSIDFAATASFTSRGVGYLTTIPGLRSLRVQYSGPISPIEAREAHALAVSPTLEALHIVQDVPYERRRAQPFSAEGLIALTHSQTLKTLSMPTGANLQQVAAMTSLEHLTLSGGADDAFPIDAQFALGVCSMRNLQSLWLDTVHFDADALQIIFANIAVRTLRVKIQHGIAQNEMAALLSNSKLQALQIDRNTAHAISVSNQRDLLGHPTLARLRIGGTWYRPHR